MFDLARRSLRQSRAGTDRLPVDIDDSATLHQHGAMLNYVLAIEHTHIPDEEADGARLTLLAISDTAQHEHAEDDDD